MTNKIQYEQFSIKRLRKSWPFSLELAKDIFRMNQYTTKSSFRDLLSFNCLREKEYGPFYATLDEYYQCYRDRVFSEKDIWYLSKYPGFFIKSDNVFYQESLKFKAKNSTTEEIIVKTYNLNNIPYDTIICEAIKFSIKKTFQEAISSHGIHYAKAISLHSIWPLVFNYLLFTTCSSSIKDILEKGNYIKNDEPEILLTFYDQFKKRKYLETIEFVKLKSLKTRIKNIEERLLNIFIVSGVSKKRAQTLINNYLLTENLDEIISFYQQLVSKN